MEKGFHIALRSKLPSIYIKGLTPRIGRRSDSVSEPEPILCFTGNIRSIPEWKNRLYPNISFDDLVILTFDVNGIEYIKRYDSSGDFFTKNTIPSDKIKIIELFDNLGNKVSLNKLQDIFLDNKSEYIMMEHSLEYVENAITEEDMKILIESLSSYEHKKWGQWQDGIFWTSHNLPNGSKLIRSEKIKEISKYLNVDYNLTDEIYKYEIRKRIKPTFYTIIESVVFDELKISEEELLSILELVEHERISRWIKYMLSQCYPSNDDYIITKEKVELWSKEIETTYDELSEKSKESDRKEAYNIITSIDKYKTEVAKATGECKK